MHKINKIRNFRTFSDIANRLAAFDGVQWAVARLPVRWSSAATARNFPLIMSSLPYRLEFWSIITRNCFAPDYQPQKSKRSTSWATVTWTRYSSITRDPSGSGEKAASSWLGPPKSWRTETTGSKVLAHSLMNLYEYMWQNRHIKCFDKSATYLALYVKNKRIKDLGKFVKLNLFN